MLPLLVLSIDNATDELFRDLFLGRGKYVLKEGHSYFLREKRHERALEYLTELMDDGYAGLYITRRHPDHIPRKRGRDGMKVIWLSTTLGRDYVDPHNLGSLTNLISSFMDKGSKAAILLDGLEYLMINNDFPRVLKFIEYVNEIVMQKKALFLVSIDPRAFEPKELALLERNADVIGN
ncbi:MAG: DUF835 domain-containing protein [Candidatus Thermoplasmatota archaeon]|nr:DUF835 domain-containing protein [Candidatus Thermoplasmatota archaeon]